jgi:hypothetical protein
MREAGAIQALRISRAVGFLKGNLKSERKASRAAGVQMHIVGAS